MNFQTLSKWHRLSGMIATLFIIILSVTGFFLLHAEDLRLQERLVSNDLLLDWYDIGPGRGPVSYPAGARWVTQIGERIYLDELELPAHDEALLGVAVIDGYYALAFSSAMLLLTPAGELVERVTAVEGLPAGIEAVAAGREGELLVRTPRGILASDLDLQSWETAGGQGREAGWSVPAAAPEALTAALLERYRGGGLPLERVILDLHSGRILGRYGPWLVDACVILFLVMSLTGWWAWFRRRAMQKELESMRG